MKKIVRDGPGTQEKILYAAEKLFSQYGFSGTSIAKISKESGVSNGLILHHYKTKDTLYGTVRERVAKQYHLALQKNREMDSAGDGVGGMMLQLFQTAFDYFQKNRTYHRISLWSYLEGKTDTVEKEALITGKMADLVRMGQDAGILEDDFDPVTLLTITIGSIHYWMRYREQFKKIFNHKATQTELDGKFQTQAAKLLKRSIVKKKVNGS